MARRVSRLTVDTLAELPDTVRRCLVWELDPVARERVARAGAEVAEKEAWVSRVLLEWGSCGRVVHVDDVPAGFVLYAAPLFFPGSGSFPSAPVSEDAVQLATACVLPPYDGQGLGRVLMQVMVKDLLSRGDIRAVECIAVTGRGLPDSPAACALPTEFLQRVGFRTARAHPRHPRLRLELKSVLTWREEVESAVERLLGVVRPGRSPASARWGELRDDLSPGSP